MEQYQERREMASRAISAKNKQEKKGTYLPFLLLVSFIFLIIPDFSCISEK